MSTYLQIAEEILRTARRPMGGRSILEAAYLAGLVPPQLYGKTQHKTLQARISEDILNFRDRSRFFRTEPGKFFLREFITDVSIPAEFRDPISTKRRARELTSDRSLALDISEFDSNIPPYTKIPTKQVLDILRRGRVRYDNPKRSNENSVFVWAFVSVRRDEFVLSYRAGKYRESRENFLHKRSIGFSCLVDDDSSTLFNASDLGITDSGISAVKLDLDIPEVQYSAPDVANLKYFMWVPSEFGRAELVGIIDYFCPKWFEPVKKRLAINDLHWLKINTKFNDIDDFDPWSKAVLCVEQSKIQRQSQTRSNDKIHSRYNAN